MPTSGQGIVAAELGTTWATAVSVNAASKGVYLRDTGNLVAVPEQLVDDSIGFVYKETIDAGKRVADFSMEGYLRFAGQLWKIIAQIIGDDAVTTVGTDRNHTMDLQDVIDGKFMTLCVFDGTVVREVPSLKWGGFVMKGTAADIWKVTLTGIGNKVIDSGQVNSSLSSVTYVTNTLRAPYNVQVRINDQSGGALDSSVVVRPTDIEFAFKRNLIPDFSNPSTLYQTSEPYEEGQHETTVKLVFPKTPITNYTAALADLENATLKKMDITITGPATGNGNNFTITISFPAVRVVNVESPIVGGNVQIPQTVTLECLKATAAPTGMTGITKPFRLVLLNSTTTAYDT